MKINDAALQQILRSYSPKRTGAAATDQTTDAASGAQSAGDSVNLSPEGQQLQRMVRTAHLTEDVRTEHVEGIRSKLRTGSYLLDPQLIANKMLGLGEG